MKVLTKYVPYTRTTGCERRGREMRRPTVYSLRRLVPLALTLCVLLGAVLLGADGLVALALGERGWMRSP